MTDITRAAIPTTAIPASNATLEMLAAWTFLALKQANGLKGAIEVEGGVVEPFYQQQIFEAPDGTFRLVMRANLKLNPAYVTDSTKKLWEFVEQSTTGSTPANFL